jgi:hypothetical protein
MFPSPSAHDAFALFAHCLNKVPDPRSKQGTSHPCSTLLAVVLLGLLAKVSTPAEIARWTKRHFSKLSKVLRFGRILLWQVKLSFKPTLSKLPSWHFVLQIQQRSKLPIFAKPPRFRTNSAARAVKTSFAFG